MKKTLVALATLALLPKLCSSGEYSRHVSPETIVENRGGQVLLQPRSGLSKRIEAFAIKHGADPRIAPELAELLAACDHPRVLAAIAAKESNFNLRARGRSGEVGAYQIIPRDWGHPGYTWHSQTKAAERILNELTESTAGKLLPAVSRYNGSGPRAAAYGKHVMAMAMSI